MKYAKKKRSVHSVKFNAVMNILLTASNMLIGLFTVPYVTRVLSVEGYGNVSFAQNMSSWLSALCLVGVSTYGVRECAKVRDDPVALASLVRELLLIITFFTAIVLTLFAVSIFLIPRFRELAPLMWMFLVSTLLLSYGVEWYYQAIEQYQYITIRSVFFKLLSLVSTFLFVHNVDDWLIYGAIFALMVCGNNVFNIFRLFETLDFHHLPPANFKRHFKPLCSFSILTVATSTYLSFDSVLLGMLNANNVQVALYQLAAKIKNICWQFINAIVGVLIPRLAYYVKNEPEKYFVLLKRGYDFTLNVCLGCMFFLFIYAKPLVVMFSSAKYIDATLSTKIIGIVNFCSCMSYFFGLCILTPLGRENKYATANLIGVPISLILNILFDGRFGAVGASVAIFVAEGTIFIKQIQDTHDILSSFVTIKDTLRTIVSHIAAFAVASGIYYFCSCAGFNDHITGNAIIILVLGFIGYVFTWLIAALLLHEDTAHWALGTISTIRKK